MNGIEPPVFLNANLHGLLRSEGIKIRRTRMRIVLLHMAIDALSRTHYQSSTSGASCVSVPALPSGDDPIEQCLGSDITYIPITCGCVHVSRPCSSPVAGC